MYRNKKYRFTIIFKGKIYWIRDQNKGVNEGSKSAN